MVTPTADPRLERLANEVRRPDPRTSRLDIHRTAGDLGVTVVGADLGDHLLGATFGNKVVLSSNSRLTEGRRRFVFAHEVAHVLIARGRMPWVDRRTEEWWADWFAHELIFPRVWLADGFASSQLTLWDDPAERSTLALQLASVRDESPQVFRVGEVVHCRRCGESPFFAHCECRPYRDDPFAALSLPEFVIRPAVCRGQLTLFDPRSVRGASPSSYPRSSSLMGWFKLAA